MTTNLSTQMGQMEPDDLIVVNGIDGATGDYLVAPLAPHDMAQLAANQPQDPGVLNVLKALYQQASQPHLGLPFDVDPQKVEEAGWAIVFHEQEEQAVKDALAPLVAHRQQCIGNDNIVKVLDYHDGETVPQWLARHKVGMGTVDPEKVPFYLLLIGSPQRIPFAFGHLLDVEYGVGRLCFDTVSGYQAYVESVKAYENAPTAPTGKDVVFFGTRHINDKPTRLSSESLVKPLAGSVPDHKSIVERVATREKIAYQSRLIAPADATKEALRNVFRPAPHACAPSFVFTATHGLGWPNGDTRQVSAQGALLCQDFPGRGLGPTTPEHYFASADLPQDARVHGMVCFHFACFGVGTPEQDRFLHKAGQQPPILAPQPFFSALPQALLSHPNGSALGVIGHVERAWPTSIVTAGAGPQLQPFENTIGFILSGKPLGYALKDFNERYAALATSLSGVLEKMGFGAQVADDDLTALWTARNDAESYVLFGDPAVCLRKEALQ